MLLVLTAFGWVCVTATLWIASVRLIEVDMDDSVRRETRKGQCE